MPNTHVRLSPRLHRPKFFSILDKSIVRDYWQKRTSHKWY